MMERMKRMSMEVATPAADKTYFYTPTATTAVQLTVLQQTVRITNNFAFDLSLPPVSKCKGLTFTISAVNATADVTITDFGGTSLNDSINWEGDFTLAAAEDSIALYCDGRTWYQVDNQIA